MKIFRSILLSALVLLFLLCSCSGGTDPGGGSPQQEKEGIKKEAENPDEDEEDEDENETEEDETEESETKDGEVKDGETKNTGGISEKTPPAAVFLRYEIVSETEIVFEFSQPVSLVSLDLKSGLEFDAIEEGSKIKIILAEPPKPALLIEVDLQVKDGHGNTVRKQVSFRTKNNRVPKMQINELRTESSKPKAEFIEFKMLSDGNLGGLRVYVAGNYKNPLLYEFASVEVKAMEYVVLHLRKLEEASRDELGESLDESGGTDSSPTGRDFWIPDSTKLLHKTDAVYVLDQDNGVLDAVMISEKSDPLWGKDYFTEAAEFLFRKGAWKSPAGTICSPADAVISSTTTLTRSICRDENVENTHTAADWYVTANSGATPGKENNIKRYN
jgi:hypothetical protein